MINQHGWRLTNMVRRSCAACWSSTNASCRALLGSFKADVSRELWHFCDISPRIHVWSDLLFLSSTFHLRLDGSIFEVK